MNGWTLLYKTVERDIETKSDVLIAVTHWQLLRVGMKCIGIGDDKTLSESDEESELLPDGWNINKTSYALRYKYQNEVFILLGMVVDDTIVLNLLNAKSMELANAAFVLEPTVAALKGQLSTLIPEIEPIIARLKKELFEPVLSVNKKTSDTQTTHTAQPRMPANILLPSQRPYGPLEQRSRDPSNSLLRELYNYGRNDLDPLGIPERYGTSGGGMVFNPPSLRNPQNIGPPGGQGMVPGARFDPFNPPEVERQRQNSRDFDHFRPPGNPGSGFYDDMFM